MQSHGEETPPTALVRELHRTAKDSRFGRSAVAREGSHQADAILVPAASRAGRQEEKLAAVALDAKCKMSRRVSLPENSKSSLSPLGNQ